jgi:hypothetical protein
MTDGNISNQLARFASQSHDVHGRSPTAQHIEHCRASRIQANIANDDMGAAKHQRGSYKKDSR